MRKEVIKVLFTVLFILTLFLSSAKTKTIEAQAYQTVNVKCNCTTAFSACGNYFGRTNVKRRTCTAIMTGSQTCTVATAGPTFWQVATCTAGPTATPTPPGGTTGTPTPTGNLLCVCNSAGACSSQCQSQFNRFTTTELPGVDYSNPIKCGLANSHFQSDNLPTANQKTGWCRAEVRTKGDADGNGNAILKDYFYFVAAVRGAKIPPTVNPDFDGNNIINGKDRAIIIKSLTTSGSADE